MRRSPFPCAAAALLAGAALLPGQQPATDTLRLGSLERAALEHDPRTRELQLQRARTALRLQDIAAERLPSLAAEGQAQYQSTVTKLPIQLPGVRIPTPANDSYDAHLNAQQQLFDPGAGPRRSVERAQLAQTESQLRVSLYPLRQQVEDAFFNAALLDAQASEVATAITDLQAQLTVTRARVREGTALRGEADAIEAELLRRQQDTAQLRADRAAALTVLADLTGRVLADSSTLAPPDLSAAVARARSASDSAWARPELQQFARARDVLAAQAGVLSAATLPRVSAFGRLGYGRPGLNFLSTRFDSYWLAGVQFQWAPWNWGTTQRDREALQLQQQILQTEQSAFTSSLRRTAVRDLATIERLQGTLAGDERIIALRESVARETRLRFGEGVVTAAEYVNRATDVLDARIARATHRVQLAQAQARYLTTLGYQIP